MNIVKSLPIGVIGGGIATGMTTILGQGPGSISGLVVQYLKPEKFVSCVKPLITLTDDLYGLIHHHLPNFPLLKVRFPEAICYTKWRMEVLIGYVFMEELVHRIGIQKIVPWTLSKVLPVRAGRLITHPAARILMSATIFSLIHKIPIIPSAFAGGLIYGALYEKYGIIAAAVAHIAHNIFTDVTCIEISV